MQTYKTSRKIGRRWWLALSFTLMVVAIQFLTSAAVSRIAATDVVPVWPFDGVPSSSLIPLRIALVHREHVVDWREVVPLQLLILLPGLGAWVGVRWLRWFPVGVLPGVIANGVEALACGKVLNGLLVSVADGEAWALSAGDVWVVGALLLAGGHALVGGVRSHASPVNR